MMDAFFYFMLLRILHNVGKGFMLFIFLREKREIHTRKKVEIINCFQNVLLHYIFRLMIIPRSIDYIFEIAFGARYFIRDKFNK